MPNNDAAKYVLAESNKRLAALMEIEGEDFEVLKREHPEPEVLRQHLFAFRKERETMLASKISPELFTRARDCGLTAQKVTTLLKAFVSGGESAVEMQIAEFEKQIAEMDRIILNGAK